MNRTIKEATIKRYHYDDHDQFPSHLADFVNTYNFDRRLKTLRDSSRSSLYAKSGQKNKTGSDQIRPINPGTKQL